jgi:hypothetical protein
MGCCIVVAETAGACPFVLAPDATTMRFLAPAASRNTSSPHSDPEDLRPHVHLFAQLIILDACLYKSSDGPISTRSFPFSVVR